MNAPGGSGARLIYLFLKRRSVAADEAFAAFAGPVAPIQRGHLSHTVSYCLHA